MKFKRIILISLILCVLSMACVSASDNQTSADNLQINDINANVINEEINEYTNDMNIMEGNTSDNGSVISDNLLSSSNSDDKLSAPKEGTRDELNNLIIAAKPGSTITLSKDYIFQIIVRKYHCLFISLFCRPYNSSSLNPFEMNPESVICPYKQFYAIATVIAKCKNYFIPWVKLKLLTYDF